MSMTRREDEEEELKKKYFSRATRRDWERKGDGRDERDEKKSLSKGHGQIRALQKAGCARQIQGQKGGKENWRPAAQ